MRRFSNSGKNKFLAQIPQVSLDADTDCITTKCKFNFAYFVKQGASQSFSEWDHTQLVKLLEKLKEYCQESLAHWKTTPLKSGHVLEIYGNFPSKSDFTRPPHVPHQVHWGRFRLENLVRLVGFVIPESDYKDKVHNRTASRFDCNTFYVVFLDKDHRFYKTENR